MSTTPEQRRALSIIEKQRKECTINDFIDLNYITLDIITTVNNKIFIHGDVSRYLPHGKTWRWKQSSTKLYISLSNNEPIMLKKLHTASKVTPSCKPPSYKIWICEFIDVQYKNKPLYFCWCEKGNKTEQNDNELNIKDFSFLKEFIRPSLAKEFGWL